MKILLLSPYPENLLPALHKTGDDIIVSTDPVAQLPKADFAISYGYRHIIDERTIGLSGGRIINVHISMLPWNKGADCNFWSFFDDTPKGVSIHQVTKGLDTGPLYGSAEMRFNPGHTLKSSYETLHRTACLHFAALWGDIRDESIKPYPQPPGGSYHRTADKETYFKMLSAGWDTPVAEVEELGRKIRGENVVRMR